MVYSALALSPPLDDVLTGWGQDASMLSAELSAMLRIDPSYFDSE
jgi:hypothetical protein